MIRKKNKKTNMKTYLNGWVLQFTLSNLLNDIVFLPQIHYRQPLRYNISKNIESAQDLQMKSWKWPK
jgi:hypothetical protein